MNSQGSGCGACLLAEELLGWRVVRKECWGRQISSSLSAKEELMLEEARKFHWAGPLWLGLVVTKGPRSSSAARRGINPEFRLIA